MGWLLIPLMVSLAVRQRMMPASKFYDLSTQTGFVVVLPGSGGVQNFSGADVEFDSLHKLFLVAQPTSSSAPSGSTIYVYDIHGNLQETINGFDFSNAFNVVPMHIALNPNLRSGYVDGPDAGVTELQAFSRTDPSIRGCHPPPPSAEHKRSRLA